LRSLSLYHYHFFKVLSSTFPSPSLFSTTTVAHDDVVVGIIVKRSIFLPLLRFATPTRSLSSLSLSPFFLKVRNNASVCQLKLKYTSFYLSLSLLFFFLFKILDDRERENGISRLRLHFEITGSLFAIVINTL
jgi:hypothetical protein